MLDYKKLLDLGAITKDDYLEERLGKDWEEKYKSGKKLIILTCNDCKYFKARMQQHPCYQWEGVGRCRRHAPTPGKNNRAVWPLILSRECWCGEFERRVNG